MTNFGEKVVIYFLIRALYSSLAGALKMANFTKLPRGSYILARFDTAVRNSSLSVTFSLLRQDSIFFHNSKVGEILERLSLFIF